MRWGRSCFVYFAQAVHGGPIKVGQSMLPETRIKTIQADLPFDMVEIGRFPGAIFREAYIHCYFRKYHIRAEWFEPSPELWQWALCARTQGELCWIPQEPPRSFEIDVVGLKNRLGGKFPYEEIARLMGTTVATVKVIAGAPSAHNRRFIAAAAIIFGRRGGSMDWDWIKYTPPRAPADVPPPEPQAEAAE